MTLKRKEFRTPYNTDNTKFSGVSCGPGLTRASDAEFCDINRILGDALQYGTPINHVNHGQAVFGDVSNLPDIAEAFDLVNAAQASFMALPSALRKLLDNDPRNLEGWLMDEANRDDAIKYGLIEPPAPGPNTYSQEPLKTAGVAADSPTA